VSAGASSPSFGPQEPVTEAEINSEAELLKSQDLLEKVARESGLEQSIRPGTLRRLLGRPMAEGERLDRAVQQLSEQLKVKVILKSNVLEVTYASSDPKQAYRVLNSLGKAYIEKNVAVHHAAGSYQFFSEQASRYQDAMNRAENALRAFAGKNTIAAPDLQNAGLATQVTNAIGQRSSIEQSVAADLNRIREDDRQLQLIPARTTTTRATTPPTLLLQQLGADMIKAEAKRSELAMKFSDDYPLVREADQEVAQAKSAFERAQKTLYTSETTDKDPTSELLRQDRARAVTDLAALQGSLGASRRSISGMQAQMVALDSASLRLQDLRREAKAAEAEYLLYREKREEARAGDELDGVRIGNAAIAVPPAIPTLPVSRVSAPLLAMGLATLVSLILTYLAAYFDPTFHSPEDVAEAIGVPVVVAINRKSA
jgi:polysaccharide biosynthesis transport protein